MPTFKCCNRQSEASLLNITLSNTYNYIAMCLIHISYFDAMTSFDANWKHIFKVSECLMPNFKCCNMQSEASLLNITLSNTYNYIVLCLIHISYFDAMILFDGNWKHIFKASECLMPNFKCCNMQSEASLLNITL